MESIHVSVLKALAERAKILTNEAIDEIIYSIDTKILVGDIHRPAEKKPRKKRVKKAKPIVDFPPTSVLPELDEKDYQVFPFHKKIEAPKKRVRKVKVPEFPPPPKMDLEKEYRAGRTSPILSEANKGIGDLPDGDENSTFYGGAKRGRKKKEAAETERGN